MGKAFQGHEENGLPGYEVELLGARIRVRSADDDLIAGLRGCFELPGPIPRPSGRDLDVIVKPASRTGAAVLEYDVRTFPPGAFEALPRFRVRNAGDLCSLLNNWAAMRESPFHVFHAGAVSCERGALLLPGTSYSGKSTLTAGLLQRGYELLSDEIGAVDRTSWMLFPYPRRLSLRNNVLRHLGLAGGTANGGSRMIASGELGGRRAPGPRPLSMIVAPRFRGKGPSRIERLGPGAAVLALAESSCGPRLGEAGLDWLLGLVRRTPVHRLVYSDLPSALDVIERTWRARQE